MKLAELIISEARERGLRHFFGLPGGGAPLDMIEAGRRLDVNFVSVAHESSAALMAAYYGHMKDTAGIAMSIKGIGAANLAAGAANAYFERMPVVCLCETSPVSVTQPEMVQHCDHKGLFDAVVKFQATLSVSEAAQTIHQAFYMANEGRPGPVLVNLPSNIALSDCGPTQVVATENPIENPDAEALKKLGNRIKIAKRPVIIAGYDVIRAGASEVFQRLVENIEAAVMVTMEARGVISEMHPRWGGVVIGNNGPHTVEAAVFEKADFIFVVGADGMMTENPWNIGIPACELAARSDYESYSLAPEIRVNGDLKKSLGSLLELQQEGFSKAEISNIHHNNSSYFQRPPNACFAVQDILEIVQSRLPDNGALFSETGAFIRLLEELWTVALPYTYFGTSGGRTMGLTIPAIIGAKLAQPERPMVGIGADGSLLMRLGELELFARMNIAVPLIIINDQALGTIKSRQKSRGMVSYGLDLHEVDFATVAKACGLNGVTVETPEQFEKAFTAAMQADKTTLIDARIDPQPYQDAFGATVGVME